MPRVPRITAKELLKALGQLGFSVIRVRGSHHYVSHEDGRSTVVPVHAGEDIGVGLLSKTLRDCEEFPRNSLLSVCNSFSFLHQNIANSGFLSLKFSGNHANSRPRTFTQSCFSSSLKKTAPKGGTVTSIECG